MARTATTRSYIGRSAVTRTAYAGTYLAIGDSISAGYTTGTTFLDPITGCFTSQVLAALEAAYDTGAWAQKQYAASGQTTSAMSDYRYRGGGYGRWHGHGHKPTVATIMLGINNRQGALARTGTYADATAAQDALIADLGDMVDYLVANYIAAGQILLCGLPPFIHGSGYTPQMYTGGDGESIWDTHNANIGAVAVAKGCVFVPMAAVYGADYNCYTTQTHTSANNDGHPTLAGHTAIANAVIAALPDLTSFIGRPAT